MILSVSIVLGVRGSMHHRSNMQRGSCIHNLPYINFGNQTCFVKEVPKNNGRFYGIDVFHIKEGVDLSAKDHQHHAYTEDFLMAIFLLIPQWHRTTWAKQLEFNPVRSRKHFCNIVNRLIDLADSPKVSPLYLVALANVFREFIVQCALKECLPDDSFSEYIDLNLQDKKPAYIPICINKRETNYRLKYLVMQLCTKFLDQSGRFSNTECPLDPLVAAILASGPRHTVEERLLRVIRAELEIGGITCNLEEMLNPNTGVSRINFIPSSIGQNKIRSKCYDETELVLTAMFLVARPKGTEAGAQQPELVLITGFQHFCDIVQKLIRLADSPEASPIYLGSLATVLGKITMKCALQDCFWDSFGKDIYLEPKNGTPIYVEYINQPETARRFNYFIQELLKKFIDDPHRFSNAKYPLDPLVGRIFLNYQAHVNQMPSLDSRLLEATFIRAPTDSENDDQLLNHEQYMCKQRLMPQLPLDQFSEFDHEGGMVNGLAQIHGATNNHQSWNEQQFWYADYHFQAHQQPDSLLISGHESIVQQAPQSFGTSMGWMKSEEEPEELDDFIRTPTGSENGDQYQVPTHPLFAPMPPLESFNHAHQVGMQNPHQFYDPQQAFLIPVIPVAVVTFQNHN